MVLRDNLQVAQNQQKHYAYQHRMERQFQVNELVYLRLQPYKKIWPNREGESMFRGYLSNYVSGQQKTWIKWLHLGDFCYNTTFHMSIGMSPFK